LATEDVHDHYDVSPEVDAILIQGPYLVRSAAGNGSTLDLTGDINGTTTIDVFGPSQFTAVTWNGVPIEVEQSDIGSLRGQLEFPDGLADAAIPALEELEWICADSLPELGPEFDDSTWVLANKTETKRPQQPSAGKVIAEIKVYVPHSY
jgi:hypothetical protein